MDEASASTSTIDQAGQKELFRLLEGRSTSLRRQANVLLVIIIAVLLGGALIFVLAPKLDNIQKSTLSDRHTTTVAAKKKIEDEIEAGLKRIQEIRKIEVVLGPFDDRLSALRKELDSAEDRSLALCSDLRRAVRGQILNNEIRLSPQFTHAGGYRISLFGQIVDFDDQTLANDCGSVLRSAVPELSRILRRIGDTDAEKFSRLEEAMKAKEPETAPIRAKLEQLRSDKEALESSLAGLQQLIVEERVLGWTPNEAEKRNGSDKKPQATVEWAYVVQTNATRLSALAIIFFLMAVLVPQYRYNIRMAAFYDGRLDSIRIWGKVPPITSIEEWQKLVILMTPNINFSKAPDTPVDQLIEIIRGTKG
jgi:hypothetical protein